MTCRVRIATTMAVGLGIGGLLFGAAPAAAQVMCGDTIGVDTPKNTKLTGDLTCSTNPALTVAGGAKLDMRGFTVDCDNLASNGIDLVGAKAKLRNGTVTGCHDGVRLLEDGRHHVSRVTAEGNDDDGFFVDSDKNQLVRNVARLNGEDGFDIEGNDNNLVNNLADENEDEGICLDNGEGNRVVSNTSTNNDNDGIELDSGANFTAIIANKVFDNGTDGLDIDSDGNQIRGNRVENNGDDGINLQDGSEDNVVTGNRAFGNGTGAGDFDLLDANLDCDNNDWRGNSFDTADPLSCIN